ncbi:hypothetical protein TELCIR_19462, partial [Teladorsagia circumcincta]
EASPLFPKPRRISTLEHIRALLRYCQNQWVWFTLGFVFLVIYAVARVFIPNFTGQVIANIVKKAGVASLVRSVTIMGLLTMVSTLFGGLRGGCFDYATALVSRQVTFIAIPLVGFITKCTEHTTTSFACERREVDRFEGKLDETLKMNKKK